MNNLACLGLCTRGTEPFLSTLCRKAKERHWEKKENKKGEEKKSLHLICPSSVQEGVFLSTFSHYNNGFTAPEKGPGAKANGA